MSMTPKGSPNRLLAEIADAAATLAYELTSQHIVRELVIDAKVAPSFGMPVNWPVGVVTSVGPVRVVAGDDRDIIAYLRRQLAALEAERDVAIGQIRKLLASRDEWITLADEAQKERALLGARVIELEAERVPKNEREFQARLDAMKEEERDATPAIPTESPEFNDCAKVQRRMLYAAINTLSTEIEMADRDGGECDRVVVEAAIELARHHLREMKAAGR